MVNIKNDVNKWLTEGSVYLKTDLKHLLYGGGWLTIGQGAATLTGFLVTVVLANTLSEQAYGTYKYVLSLYGLVTVASLTGMGVAVTRATAQGKEGTLKYATLLSLRWGLVMTTLAVFAGGWYLYKGNMLLGWSLGLMALIAPLLQSFALYQAFVNGKKDYRQYTYFSISYSIFPPLVLIVTALLTESVLALVAAFLLGETFTHAVHYYLTLRKYKPNDEVDRAAVGFGKHLSLMSVMGGISFQLDKILVWQFLGAAPLALYSIATAPPQQLRYLNKVLTTITLPRFSNRGVGELQATMHHKASLVFAGSVLIVGAYWIAAPFIYELFFPKYLDAVPYSQVFSLIILFFPATLYQNALHAHLQKQQLYVLQIIIPIVKMVCLLVLLPLWGLWGVFGAMFLSEAARLMLVTYFFYAID